MLNRNSKILFMLRVFTITILIYSTLLADSKIKFHAGIFKTFKSGYTVEETGYYEYKLSPGLSLAFEYYKTPITQKNFRIRRGIGFAYYTSTGKKSQNGTSLGTAHFQSYQLYAITEINLQYTGDGRLTGFIYPGIARESNDKYRSDALITITDYNLRLFINFGLNYYFMSKSGMAFMYGLLINPFGPANAYSLPFHQYIQLRIGFEF